MERKTTFDPSMLFDLSILVYTIEALPKIQISVPIYRVNENPNVHFTGPEAQTFREWNDDAMR